MNFSRPLLFSLCIVGCASPQKISHEEGGAAAKLAPREDLPMAARDALTARMIRHGDQMTALMAGVILLNYDLAEEAAAAIAREPKLGRPAVDDKASINALLPKSFFVHQDELADRISAFSLAAREKNASKLADAFGELTKTCVGCHSAYLHEEWVAITEDNDPS